MFYSIQGLRGIAAVLIVFHHYGEIFPVMHKHGVADIPLIYTWGNLEHFGAIGVPIFFVISGFVIGLQSFDSGARGVLEFSARRFARIVPSYWLLTLVAVPIMNTWDIELILKSLFFVAGGPANRPIIGPGWSLEYEMFFYLLFAVLVVGNIAGTAARGMILLTLVLGSMVLVQHLTGGEWFSKYGSPMVLEFCAGLLIAKTYKLDRVSALSGVLLLVGIALALCSLLVPDMPKTTTRPLWSTTAFFLVLGLVGEEHLGRAWLGNNILQVLGLSSYAIYLIHQPLSSLSFRYMLWHWKWHQAVDPNIALLLMCAWACIAGVVYYYLIERGLSAATRRWLLKWIDLTAVRFRPSESSSAPRGP